MKISNLHIQISKSLDTEDLNWYLFDVAVILSRALELYDKDPLIPYTKEALNELVKLENEYILIVYPKYTPIKPLSPIVGKTDSSASDTHILSGSRCDNCKSTEFYIDGYISICINCGSQIEDVTTNSTISDVDRCNFKKPLVKAPNTLFIANLEAYLSRPSKAMPLEVYELVKTTLEANKLGPSKINIRNILKKLKLTSFFNNINSIENFLLGTQPIQLSSDAYNQLALDFDTFLYTYNELNLKAKFNRSNFINLNLLLYVLLTHNSIPCKKADLIGSKSSTNLKTIYKIVNTVFDHLKWNRVV